MVTQRRTSSPKFAVVAACVFAALMFPCDLAAESQSSQTEAVRFPKLIFNNDMTNLDGVFMPWRLRTPDQAVADVNAAFLNSLRYGLISGVDAQSLSVHYSTFPWWRSRLYSLGDHDRFLRTLPYYSNAQRDTGYPGRHISALRAYSERGNDLLTSFGRIPLINHDGVQQVRIFSFRVNDSHYTYNYDIYKTSTREQIEQAARANKSPFCDSRSSSAIDFIEYWTQTSFTAFHEAFATGRLDQNLDGRCVRALCVSSAEFRQQCGDGSCILRLMGSRCPTVTLNFSEPVVRKFKTMQIVELADAYEPQFLELDFNRFPSDFEPQRPLDERAEIISSWLSDLRRLLQSGGRKIVLGLRVPNKKLHRDLIGISLRQIAESDLADYVILAMPYFSDQQPQVEIDLKRSKLKFYAEMTHETGAPLPDSGLLQRMNLQSAIEYREFPTSSRQLKTAAHLAYQRGFFGLALFNMHYYRRLSARVPAISLPEKAIECMSARSCVAKADQEYFLGSTHYHLPGTSDMLPFRLHARTGSHPFSLFMSPPTTGWGSRGLISMNFVVDLPPGRLADLTNAYSSAADAIRLKVNGAVLRRTANSDWPEDHDDDEANRAQVRQLWFLRDPFTITFEFDPSTLTPGEVPFEVEIAAQASALPIKIIGFRAFLPAR